MKITREIYLVAGEGLSAAEDAAAYLIVFGTHAAMVDAGCGWSVDRIYGNILECGVSGEQLEYLLLTHCHFDHTGGADAIRRRTGCKIVAHALDAPFLERGDGEVTAAGWYGASLKPFPVDVVLEGEEEEILLGERSIRAIHTPGHSPGSVVYLVESDGKKVLFGQDIHGPLHASLLSDRGKYLRSLESILSLEPDILCEGHYGVFQGKKRSADFIRQFLND